MFYIAFKGGLLKCVYYLVFPLSNFEFYFVFLCDQINNFLQNPDKRLKTYKIWIYALKNRGYVEKKVQINLKNNQITGSILKIVIFL
jgi:hypothetical protein